MITLHPRKIVMAKALNLTDAWRILDWIKDLINDTYARRDEILPNYERRVQTSALDIYGWLPKTNCRQCGEQSCFAFAGKLLLGEQRLNHCQPLFQPENVRMKDALLDIAIALGVEV